MRFLIIFVSLLSLGALPSCQRKSAPAPVEVGHGVAGGQAYTLDLENVELTTNNEARGPLAKQSPKSTPQKKIEETQPDRPDFVIVREGETLYSIASLYKMSGAEIISLNNLQAPYRLDVGQKVYLKKSAMPSSEGVAATPTSFIWPVQGRMVSPFGENGNEGVNIAAPKNTPVYATQNGKVTYVGSDLEDFGNMILLTHSDNWRSAYAHLDRASVQQGEEVIRGQVIGYVGSSGSVKTPQVHFELRKGADSVNPKDHVK